MQLKIGKLNYGENKKRQGRLCSVHICERVMLQTFILVKCHIYAKRLQLFCQFFLKLNMEKTRRQTEERRLSLDREVFCV